MAKNLGQVEGLYIGSSAPTNTALIWYDTSSNKHKVYDISLGAWKVLDPTSITSITYSSLVSRAGGQGLTQGQWFKITDRSNTLALAITGTKVQYVNNNGVPVVDDLGTHVSYSITSENLLIDESEGVYDASTNKLVFSFSETTPVMNTGDTDIDYVYGVQKRGNTKTQRKFRLSSFLSTVTGNDISWNGGFFLNFYNKLKSYFNVSGGVATHEALESYKALNNQAIQQIGENTQQAIQQVGTNIDNATTDAQIYSKRLPSAPTAGTPVDIAQNDTLQTIVQKAYRWIQNFKTANGIAMPLGYTPAVVPMPVTNRDSVSSAISKLMKYASNHENGDNIKVSSEALVPYAELPNDIENTDDLKTAINKLIYFIHHINSVIGDGEITGAKLHNYTITGNKIDYYAIVNEHLANGSVSTVKIANDSIVTDKIADKSITIPKLSSGVQFTDICRLDVYIPVVSSSDIANKNVSLGFCVSLGNGGMFTFDSNTPRNPYSNPVADLDSKDYPIISFAPVVPVNIGDISLYMRLYHAAPMLHYAGEISGVNMYFQGQIVFSDEVLHIFTNLSYSQMQITVQNVNIYGNSIVPSTSSFLLPIRNVNLFQFPISPNNLLSSGRHLIVAIKVDFE